MKLKKNKERKCPCGRIITDPNNKTGLCPKCQKQAGGVAAGVGVAGVLVGIKKFGPKVARGIINIIKK